MKNNTYILLLGLSIIGLIAASCSSSKNTFPVANRANIKPLSDEKQLEKQLYFSEAMKYYEMLNWPAADAFFKKAIATDPGCDACFFEMANMYFRMGYINEALSLSQSAVLLDSSNFWYRIQQAQMYGTTRQYRKAIKEYNYLLKQRPAMENLYFELSTLYARVGNLDSALVVLAVAEQKIGYSEQLAGTRFELLSAQGKNEEAVATLEELVANFPEARYYTLLGEHYGAMQKDSLALQMFQEALVIDPNFTPAALGEIDNYRRSRKFDTFFEKMYTLYANKQIETEYKVDYLSVILQIPQFSLTFTPQLDSVFMYLRTPADTLTEPLYATYLMQQGKRDEAVEILQNNLQNNLSSESAWQQYLAIEYYMNNWETLSRKASEASVRFPENVDFMTMNAIALSQTQRDAEAITWLEKTLPLTKDDPKQTVQTYAFLGDLYHAENNSKKAYEYYEKVLAIDTANVVVLNNYAYYLSEENKQLEKAYKMSKKAIEIEPDNATYLDTFGWILFKMGKAIEAKAIFRHAMIYGGKESAVILDHYGDVLHALGENDTAAIYWNLSLQKEPNEKVSEKIKKVK